jgi:hypothetical protein
LIEGYLQTLLDAVAASPIVRSSSVLFDRRTLDAGLIRGELTFADSSSLHFRELVEMRARVVRIMYSYHYQREDGSLIFRYDDTPHFPPLPRFPHHKHIGSQTEATPSQPPDLIAVLREIETMYPLSE